MIETLFTTESQRNLGNIWKFNAFEIACFAVDLWLAFG
jgi:hypothetical protein